VFRKPERNNQDRRTFSISEFFSITRKLAKYAKYHWEDLFTIRRGRNGTIECLSIFRDYSSFANLFQLKNSFQNPKIRKVSRNHRRGLLLPQKGYVRADGLDPDPKLFDRESGTSDPSFRLIAQSARLGR